MCVLGGESTSVTCLLSLAEICAITFYSEEMDINGMVVGGLTSSTNVHKDRRFLVASVSRFFHGIVPFVSSTKGPIAMEKGQGFISRILAAELLHEYRTA